MKSFFYMLVELVSLGLFVGMIAVWSGVLTGGI